MPRNEPVAVILAGGLPAAEAVLRQLGIPKRPGNRYAFITCPEHARNVRGCRDVRVYELVGWDLRWRWEDVRYLHATLEECGIVDHQKAYDPAHFSRE